MFGIFDAVEDACDSITDSIEATIRDPFGTAVNIVTQPIVDTVDILEGLSEGELRTHAALRLGADVVVGMGTAEIIERLT